MRLDKYLCDCNMGTRTQVKKLIAQGEVLVDQQVCRQSNLQIDPDHTQVICKGVPITYAANEYYMLNKPMGCVCASTDQLHDTIFRYVPMNLKQDLFSVGRLDLDTEGLLLVTNDGELSHRLLSPRHHVEKMYEATVEGKLTDEDIEAFAQGLDIGEKRLTLPATLEILESGAVSVCRVTISEGKFHQIKRMFHVRGKEVTALKRLTMGAFVLDPALLPGEYRKLTEEEMKYVEQYKCGDL